MTGPGFVHLHVHSAYSLLEGALKLKRLLDLAAADRQPAIGVADTGNLFGALEFSEKAAELGIQPLIGCELAMDFGGEERSDERQRGGKDSIVLIAASEAGFSNLSRLVSRSYLEEGNTGAKGRLDWLDRESTEGLICLTGGPEGALDRLFASGREAEALKRAAALEGVFGDRLYVELQRHDRGSEAAVEPHLIDLAYARGLPLVATNEPYFATPDDFEAHDALLAIAGGTVLAQTERRKLTPEHFFKTRDEMMALFSDLPEALDNSVEIARRVGFRPRTKGPILPKFAARRDMGEDEALAAEAEELARQAHAALEAWLATAQLAPGCSAADYRERLDYELKVIRDMKYPGYFLIVADFIQWAKARDIPVGPGRGSGAGSLVAFVLTITGLDPLRYDLLFERFLNPERVSMPDFDIDFCQDRREEVIAYVQQKYGRDKVAQIITFGTLQARAVLRDVGRVLQMPYGQVDRICKMVPANPANPVTLQQALADEPRLRLMRDEDETVAELLEIGGRLEGLYRHASTHAAGIVIGDEPLQDVVPLYRDPRSDMPVTQYSLKWVEPAGLVKFDFLGLKTLTVIDNAVRMVNRGRDGAKRLAIADIPLDDAATFEMLAKGDTVGVFQVESQGMRRALIDMRPDRFEDLIALVALYRPGPMANIPVYCARKLGKEPVTYLHQALEPILERTYGIITYQEQVQQIARDLAGYTLAEADLLRRAMGKKIKAEMEAQRGRFMAGATERGVGKATAREIFDACAKFSEYGFNKSHSAPYALLTYQTAWLKVHHPHEFLAASMTLDMGNTDKLSDFKREAGRLGIEVAPPCVNRSEVAFSVKAGQIVYGLAAVKGMGRQVAENLVTVRGGRPFSDLADFATRIDPRSTGRRTLETLVYAGAFDALVASREQAFGAIDAVLGVAQRTATDRADGISDMFASDTPEPISLPAHFERWTPTERLEREFSAIGFHLSAHPLDDYAPLFDKLGVQRWAEFERAVREGAGVGRLAGTVSARLERKTRRGTAMAIFTFSDPTGSFECIAFAEQIGQFGQYLESGMSAIVDVQADQRAEGTRLRLLAARPIEEASGKISSRLVVFAGDHRCLKPIKSQLRQGGEGAVSLVVIRDGGDREYEIELPGKFQLGRDLAGAIKSVEGVVDVRLN